MKLFYTATFATAVGLAANLVSMAPASAVTTFATSGPSSVVDVQFNNLCGGSDNFACEFTVAEGRVGDGGGNAQSELIIFDRLNGGAVGDQANGNGDATGPFVLQYSAISPQTIMLSMLGTSASFGVDLAKTDNGPNNPDMVAQSLVLRVRDADLTKLELNSNLGSTDLGDFGALQQLDQSDVGYLYLGGFDLTQDWTLFGDFAFDPTASGSGSAFQVKVTDLVPIPLPAGIVLLAGALGLLGAGRVLRRA